MLIVKEKAAGAGTPKAAYKTNFKPNHNKYSSPHQGLSGWHLYEFLKRSFIDANPRCTSTEYDQACYRFARLAGV